MRPQEDMEPISIQGHNGWRMWEKLPVGAKPRYRWRKTWSDQPCSRPDEDLPDITGYDDDVEIGRVFKLSNVNNRDAWFWVLYPPPKIVFYRPVSSSGWELSMPDAALRVEWCYDHMMRLLENFPHMARKR